MSGVIFDPLLGQLRTSDTGGTASPLTTKGDIYGFSTLNARIPVGADGTVLTADSTQTLGVKWNAVTGTGTVTSVSVTTANGVSGSVATATTTPAITLTLGAITPTSVNSVVLSGSSTPTLAVTGTSSVSGANTGDQTITLTSDVTGSGTGSFATTIRSSVALAGSPTTTTQTPADNSTKIATTAYVDNAVLGQNFKEAVGAATTANLVGTYLNGTSGVGATFTYTATGVDTIDGIALTLGMRVLLKNQTTAFQNGLYTVTTAGAIGVAGILTRATDGDQTTDWKTGDSTFVTAGTTLSATTWAYTGIDSPTMGSTSLTFAQTAGQGSLTAGAGITITGNSIAITVPVTVALGGTNATSASITAFNNITGYTAAGATGTTSTNLVFSTSPVLVTPSLGVATATSINTVVLSGSSTPTLAVTGTSTISGTNTGDQTITLTGAVTGSGTGSFATTLATPGTLTVSSTNSNVTAHTHAITSSSAPGAAASLLATDSSGIIGSTGTRIVKGWFTDLTVTNAITGSITGNAATATTASGLTSATTTVVVSAATAPTSGQVLTASGTTAASWVTPGASITWNNVTGTTQSAAVNNGYIANNASLVTVTLPTTAAIGSIIEVAGAAAGGWKLAQNASQLVNFGTSVTTTGTGGSLASVNRYDAVRVICITANTTWAVISSQGNITVT